MDNDLTVNGEHSLFMPSARATIIISISSSKLTITITTIRWDDFGRRTRNGRIQQAEETLQGGFLTRPNLNWNVVSDIRNTCQDPNGRT